jgi:predicted RNase H-like HicB family nuclease
MMRTGSSDEEKLDRKTAPPSSAVPRLDGKAEGLFRASREARLQLADYKDVSYTDRMKVNRDSQQWRLEMLDNISFTVNLFKEDGMFVAQVPELNVASCGYTVEEAQSNIKEAVECFLEGAEELGTLNEILEEAGYRHEGERWVSPEFVSTGQMTVSLSA